MKVVPCIFVLALTASDIITFKILYLEKVGQGHGLLILQWCHSVSNIKIYYVIFACSNFAKRRTVRTKAKNTHDASHDRTLGSCWGWWICIKIATFACERSVRSNTKIVKSNGRRQETKHNKPPRILIEKRSICFPIWDTPSGLNCRPICVEALLQNEGVLTRSTSTNLKTTSENS